MGVVNAFIAGWVPPSFAHRVSSYRVAPPGLGEMCRSPVSGAMGVVNVPIAGWVPPSFAHRVSSCGDEAIGKLGYPFKRIDKQAGNAMANAHRLRIGRYSQGRQIYLITGVCWKRQRLFSNFVAARIVVRSLHDAERSAKTLCYVVMPDHFHWLMQLEEGVDLSATVRFVRALSTMRIKDRFCDVERIWQKGFYDRMMRREEDLQAVARYVVANPVRAGLVRSVREYSFWDAIWI